MADIFVLMKVHSLIVAQQCYFLKISYLFIYLFEVLIQDFTVLSFIMSF